MSQNNLYLGDCLEVLPTLEENSVDAVVTDPPYGLSQSQSTQGISNRIYNALFEVGFPQLHQRHMQAIQGLDFPVVPEGSPFLGSKDGAVGIHTGISVPERSIDFDDDSRLQKEVNHGNVASSLIVSDTSLSLKGNSSSSQFLGNFVLKFRHMDSLSATSNVPDGCLAEAFFGGFGVPILADLDSGLPSLASSGTSVVFGNDGIRIGYNTCSYTQSTPGVVTFPGTVNSIMLRFDLRGRPVELLAANRASHLSTIGLPLGAQLVRAFPSAGGLASEAEPCRVRFVGFAADGTRLDYWFHLWVPPSSSIKSIIPRGGFMGKEWDSTLPDPQIWRELLRVAKPGAHLLAFGGTRTFHRLFAAIEDAGWELRDTIMWTYGSGFPKGQNIGKAIDSTLLLGGSDTRRLRQTEQQLGGESYTLKGRNNGMFGEEKEWSRKVYNPVLEEAARWEGWNTQLKPAWEPICVARKPVVGTVAANVLQYGTGALNVDACRIGTADDLNPNDYDDSRRRSPKFSGTLNNGKTGEYRQGIGNVPSGRWPANLIHDGSDEVMALFPTTEPARSGVKRPNNSHKNAYNGIQGAQPDLIFGHNDKGGSAARFFYCAKASPRERGEGNNHPTVKPLALMTYLCRLVTQPGGVVLDPFMGSGSTGVAALLEGFRFVGIEKNEEYFSMAEKRISSIDLPIFKLSN